MYRILMLNKIKSLYHRHNIDISSQNTFFGDIFATGSVPQFSTTLPLQHVLEKTAFRVASPCSPPCFTDNFAAHFSADAPYLPLDGALQLCQVLRITLIDFRLQLYP